MASYRSCIVQLILKKYIKLLKEIESIEKIFRLDK